MIEAFNELIARHLHGGTATVPQNEVIARIRSKLGVSRSAIFENGWLNVEPLFRRNGWEVRYDKPGYNETYQARFIFHECDDREF